MSPTHEVFNQAPALTGYDVADDPALLDALRRAEHISAEVGIRAVEVDAIDDAARRFYLKFGFVTLADAPNHLFLPIHVIRKLGLPPVGGGP